MNLNKWALAGAITGIAAGLMYYTAPISGMMIFIIGTILFAMFPILGSLSVPLAVMATYGIYCTFIFSVLGYCQWRSGFLSEVGMI